MTDFDFPELPSDDELGITDEDREAYKKDFGAGEAETSDPELAELLKDVPAKPSAEAGAESADGAGGPTARGVDSGVTKRKWRGPITLVVLLLVSTLASSRTGLPRPVPANAPDSAFSSARAMSTLVDMARRPHPPGSPEHTRVRDFVVAEMMALGMNPEIQTATSLIQSESRARAATVRNVVARIPGTSPTGGVLITAHYDSREGAVGAGDDGSGVVAALEAIRALQTGPPLRNDLIVVFTDAEELGLLGARAFVKEHALMADADVVLSFEMRGGGGPSIMFETADQNGWIVRTMKEWDTHPFANSMSYEVYKRMPNGTDFTPFIEAGAQGLNYAAIDNAHVYHQAFDTPDNLSEATLQHHGIHALGALKYYGEADLTQVNDGNVVYGSVPGIGLIVYGQGWVLPISGVLLVMLVITVLVGRRLGATSKGMALGVAGSLVVLGVAYGVGYSLMQWLPGVHGEVGMLHGSVFHKEGWYMLALAFSTLFIVTVVTGVLSRWATIVELAIGALVVPSGLAVALSFVAPLAAMNLQWPTIAAAVSVVLLTMLKGRWDSTVGWFTALLLAVPVILVFQQIVELVWMALTLRLAGLLAVLIGVMLLLCLPALNALRHPNAWWAPLTAAALAGASLGMGVLGARANVDRPAPSTLVYAYEHGSGDAVWATSPGEQDRPGAIWAASAAQVSFDEMRDLSVFGFRSQEVPVATAPVFEAAPPEAYVIADTVENGVRLVDVRVRSRIGAELMQFHLAEGVVLESINGTLLEDSGTVRLAEHWGEPDGFVALNLRMPEDAPIGVHVVEHLLRPDEIVGEGRFDRPGRLAPNVNWMSDRAMFRFSVAALADPRHAIVVVPPPPSGMFEQSERVLADTLRAGEGADELSDGRAVGRDTLQTDSTSVGPSAVDSLRVDSAVVDTGATAGRTS